jgi:hypothetical protein
MQFLKPRLMQISSKILSCDQRELGSFLVWRTAVVDSMLSHAK